MHHAMVANKVHRLKLLVYSVLSNYRPKKKLPAITDIWPNKSFYSLCKVPVS